MANAAVSRLYNRIIQSTGWRIIDFDDAVTFRKRIQQMEQQLSSLTAAIMNSDLSLHKRGKTIRWLIWYLLSMATMTDAAHYIPFVYTVRESVCLFIHVDENRVSEANSGVCVWFCESVCLCVCPHDKTKTVEIKIAKFGTGIVYHDFSSTNEY